jgi:hypothetical protein
VASEAAGTVAAGKRRSGDDGELKQRRKGGGEQLPL